MKKIFLIILLFCIKVHSQKVLEIYNTTTSLVFEIKNVITDASGNYPEFHVKYFGPIVLNPSSSYLLENNLSLTRFPFHSPTSSPYIGSWERFDSPTAPIFYMSSEAAWMMGDNQVFKSLTFTIGGNTYSIGPTNPFINGGPWYAEYVSTGGTYTVVFYE